MVNYCSTETSYTTNCYYHYIRWFGTFSAFWDSYKYKNMDKITQILENVVRCKYFEAGVRIKNPTKNSYQDGLGRTTQTLDHVVVVHILIWAQINEYKDYWCWPQINKTHAWHIDLSSICRIDARNGESEGNSQSDLAGWWWEPKASRNTPPNQTKPNQTKPHHTIPYLKKFSCIAALKPVIQNKLTEHMHEIYIELSSICRIEARNGECEGSSHCWGCWWLVEVEE
jgi:hypothetical protein